jgi:hypothetical protein
MWGCAHHLSPMLIAGWQVDPGTSGSFSRLEAT